MAAHTFAPEEALPPPKSTVIYSRDGRKRSINIDIAKQLVPSLHDFSSVSTGPTHFVTAAVPVDTHVNPVSGIKGDPISNYNGSGPAGSSSAHKKKKKKKTKKKGSGMIEESEGMIGRGSASTTGHHHHHHHHEDDDDDDDDLYSDEDAYDPEIPALSAGASSSGATATGSVAAATVSTQPVSNSQSGSNASKKKKKKKKKASTTRPTSSGSNNATNHSRSQSHGKSSSSSKAIVQSSHRNGHDRSSAVKRMHDSHTQNDGFWHYSDAEERQRIREFWFQLREEERRSLVRVEKEAVLKKMKEQQRHSCSCSLCGRKRTAIEEELELLYDAYYDELEQYANQQQPSDGHALTYPQHSSTFEEDDLSDESRHSDEEDDEGEDDDDDEEDEDEEGYEDEDDDEEYEDDEVSNRKAPFTYRSGFPNTLQAKGNILTVAEDLLENDGKKFLEMMDRLADRKVQRDDESLENRGAYEEYDDEEEGEFEDEGVEEDALTKEQRMEEGRRMFQAFAARMFEQRVLSAYREKVAQERQERLLAELEEESRQEQLREERKEREKEKKRDKKRLQRQQKEEEKAAKEAQRLAEEKRALEERERKLEAERKRRDDERRAKEEEKRLREEERLKKEEERKRKLKEEKAREAGKERKRKDEQLAKEQEEQARRVAEEARKAEEAVRRAEEAAKEETRRREREAYLKQQLAEEQRRQEELRQQEQLAKEELAKQEQEQVRQSAATVAAAAAASAAAMAASAASSSPRAHIPESGAIASPGRGTRTTSDAGTSGASQVLHSRSPVMPSSTSPIHVPDVASSQPLPAQPSTPNASNLWASPYPPQGIPQSPLQHMFSQPMQQGLYRPPGHFGHIGELDPFPSRMGHGTGRNAFMGPALQSQSPFQTMPQLQQPSSPLPQQMGGLRSPGLPPIGYGQTNVPAKQLLTLMNPNGVAGNQDLTSSAGSPLHSPSTLGAIGTPIGPFGPISPIGHTRRTSTPYGPTSGDGIKPIQRPVPIGRPKDMQHHPGSGPISNSFDSLSLGLSGLSIAPDLERRPRSPSLNLTGSGSLDLESIAFAKESMRASNNGSDNLGHGLSSDPVHLQPLSPGIRNQRESSFFSNSIFGGRVTSHDPFLQSSDFATFGQQHQGHGALPNSAQFMSPYQMHHPSSQQPQPQQQHQQLFMQQQQQQFMHPNIQDSQQLQHLQHQQQQHQQQLGLNSPTLDASASWGRTGFMRQPHMDGLGSNIPSSAGPNPSPSRTVSPPPSLGNLHNGPSSPMMPIGPPNGMHHSSQQQQQQQQQQQARQFVHFPANGNGNGLALPVGSGRKSVSHLPPI
ncbi:salt tolerance down-regulator-domain-containing protein [Mortierella sp. GBAus27b]|nr:Stress response protein nst1 [Mortierella sp. GBA43]KAI8356995.1 salt tolerance down-regulator-domain-containing protein [Mortierella sp. GBAus27b]